MRLTGPKAMAVALLALGLALAEAPASANPLIPTLLKGKMEQSEPATVAPPEEMREEPRASATTDQAIQGRLERLVAQGIMDAEQAARTLSRRFAFAVSGYQEADREISLALARMIGNGGASQLLVAVGLASLPFLLGLAAELAHARMLRPAERWLAGPASVPVMVLPRVLGLGVLHLSRIIIFMIAALIMVVLILPDQGLSRRLALFYALPVLWLRVIPLAVWLLLMPAKPHLRLLPCSQAFARHLFRWLCVFFAVTILAYNTLRLLRMNGLGEATFLLLTILEMCMSLGVLFALVWTSPRPVAGGPEALAHGPAATPRWRRDWRLPATGFLCAMFLAYVSSVLLGRLDFRWAMLWSLASIPVLLAADTVMRATIHAAMAEEPPQAEGLAVMSVHAAHFLKGFRVLLAVAWFFLLLWIWGVRFSFEAAFARLFFSVMATIVLGWFTWEWIRSAIDRRLTEDSREEEGEEREDVEEMGIGGSRKATLLTLARKFILVVIVAATGLIMLSALGVNIGPLLAGAGIAGLAIGFGAQALVKDILSGVFYLLDDAFRLGDYIEADSSKGTVVHISVRSLKLRHPRGRLQTIPFGSLGAITNYSRDWAIMKLDLRVPFDTDLEKVRKIMKKLGQRLADDPELGPKFLAPLKSQGVREIDDSAMILRVKFKSRPHDQFILRREVFKHIQNKFAENGIEFAPRKVIVHVPDSYPGASKTELDMGIMAAAAESALEEKPPQDAAKKDKKP